MEGTRPRPRLRGECTQPDRHHMVSIGLSALAVYDDVQLPAPRDRHAISPVRVVRSHRLLVTVL